MIDGHARPDRQAPQPQDPGNVLSPKPGREVAGQVAEPARIWRANEEMLVAGMGAEDFPHEDAPVDDRPYFVLMERAVQLLESAERARL